MPTGAARDEFRVALQLVPDQPALLLPGELLPQIVSDPAISPVPGCAGWFLGVLARRGTVVPVFDINAHAGRLPLPAAGRYVVMIESAQAPVAVVCAKLPAVVPVSPAIRPTQFPELPIAERYIVDWKTVDGAVLPVFDLLRWVVESGPGVLR